MFSLELSLILPRSVHGAFFLASVTPVVIRVLRVPLLLSELGNLLVSVRLRVVQRTYILFPCLLDLDNGPCFTCTRVCGGDL